METQGVQPEDDMNFSVQDFIPKELQEAYDETVKEEEVEQAPAQEAPITDSAEEVEFSPEAIDKLIDGDINALNRQPESTPTQQDEEQPFWVEEEDYKNISQILDSGGVESKVLNDFIRKVADKTVVDNGTVLNGLRKEVETYKRQMETLADEAARGKEIARGVNFDNDPETKAKYIQPLQSNLTKIQSILTQEGAKITAGQTAGITNKATLMRTLQEQGVDDAKATEILAEWRAHQDTFSEYSLARQEAMQNAAGLASAKLSPDKAQNILKNSIMEMIEQEEYAEIKEAIRDGIDKHEDISGVINKGRNNFLAIAQTLPVERQQDVKFMSDLAKYTINAANAERVQKSSQAITAERDTWKEKAVKLAKAYKELASSAGGIQGKPLTPTVARSRSRMEEEKSQEELVKEFEKKLASGDAFGGKFFVEEE